jgi:hypothetical protein
MAPGKGEDDKDNPLYFSGDIKVWPTFKDFSSVSGIRML